jgi:DNA-binding NarL/FixJ family response regulator
LLQRDAEMAALDRQLAEVRAGAGRVIVVEGPAGIGKSSLLTAVTRAAAATGLRALRAWGGPLEHDAGWGIARQLFAPVRAEPGWDGLAVGAAALAKRVLDAEPDAPGVADDAMYAAAHGLTWLVSGLAERGPTLLIVDDVHWADAPSLRWLVQLARQLGELPLGVLCAVRAGEPPGEPGLLAELLAAAAEPPVRPLPLGPAAVEQVVSARLPAAGSGFAFACHAATAGNPYLLTALLDHLIAERVEPSDEVGARLGAFGPEQVARGVERQLARLPAGAGALARAFAVLGRDAPLRHASELAGLPAEEAAHRADQLRAAGLLEGEGLVHPLVARALYDGMPAGERGLAHAAAARLLERERADPETVALHLLRTEGAGDAGTVAILCAAAERAGARGALESAATFLRRALAEPPLAPGVEADVRSRLGLLLATRTRTEAPDLLESAVDRAASADQRSRIALSGARALGLAGYFPAATALCRRVLNQPGDAQPGEVQPDVLARLEAELTGNAWLDVSTVAEARERLHRQAGTVGHTELWRVHAAWEAVCEARPVTEARAHLAAGLEQIEPGSILGTHAALALIACGDLEPALEHCVELIDAARPRGWLTVLAHGCFLRAIANVRAGRIRDAEADARLAFDFKLANSPSSALMWAVIPLVDALIELDERAEADNVLTAAGCQGPLIDGALTTPMVLERRARLRLAQGRPSEAHADLCAAAERWAALGIRHPWLAAWRVDDCEALAALGDLATARDRAEEHLDLAERAGIPGPRGAGLRALARVTGSVEQLEAAVELLAPTADRLEHTRALVELGSALRRANRRAAAREPLSQALAQADRDGMRRLAVRARQELHAVGARPRRSALAGVDALTPAEHRVARLAADGLGNRDIAQELFVTRRTVETHLTHAFQKLGVTTRADLAAFFQA